jgi:hypothetical protein
MVLVDNGCTGGVVITWGTPVLVGINVSLQCKRDYALLI